MVKFVVYPSAESNKSIAWDSNSSAPFVIDSRPQQLLIPSSPPVKRPLKKEDSKNLLIFVFSKKYPVNITLRQDKKLIQDFPDNVPYVQLLEDILKTGSSFSKIKNNYELRQDNDPNRLTQFEKDFYDFLQDKTIKSFREYIKGKGLAPKKLTPTKSVIEIELYGENYNTRKSVFNVIFSNSNIDFLSSNYKFDVVIGTINSKDDDTNQEDDIFDYDASKPLDVNIHSTNHFSNYWNHLNLEDDNLLSLYANDYQVGGNNTNLHSFSHKELYTFSHFGNLFPNVLDYNNPLLLKVYEAPPLDSPSIIVEYKFDNDADKFPQRNGKFTCDVVNSNCAFKDSEGIIRRLNGLIFFIPSDRVLPCMISTYNWDTGEIKLKVNNTDHTRKNIKNLTEENFIKWGLTIPPDKTGDFSINQSGLLYISDNYTLYFLQGQSL